MPENGSGSYIVLQHPASDLERLLTEFRQVKFTGSIQINFSQGSPSGTIEVKRKFSASFFEISHFGLPRSEST